MPAYDVAAAAEALGVASKRVDNILSRNSLPGVEHRRRGVTRRIPADAVITLRIALELGDALGLAVPSALNVARLIRENGGTLALGSCARLTVDLQALEGSTLARLDDAVETVGRRPRGRPKRRSADAGDQLV